METVMDDLNLKTADELVRLHNAMCAEEGRIDGPWKKSKRALIERIRAFGEPVAAEGRAAIIETVTIENAKTVGTLVEALVATNLAYGEIVRTVKARFPNANTTTRSVASVASALRQQGREIPMRRSVR
jgi:hypothetical protein